MKVFRTLVLSLAVLGVMWLVIPESVDTDVTYVKFQDRMSMDWDGVQERILISNAVYEHGIDGSPEDYAYNIIVALNRMLSEDYPNTIEEVCNLDLVEVIPENARQGMRLVKFNRWDFTNGSLDYK